MILNRFCISFLKTKSNSNPFSQLRKIREINQKQKDLYWFIFTTDTISSPQQPIKFSLTYANLQVLFIVTFDSTTKLIPKGLQPKYSLFYQDTFGSKKINKFVVVVFTQTSLIILQTDLQVKHSIFFPQDSQVKHSVLLVGSNQKPTRISIDKSKSISESTSIVVVFFGKVQPIAFLQKK